MTKPTVFDSMSRDGQDAIRIVLTPEIALEMLDANKINRPLQQSLVNRIADQIRRDRWKYNGDTIKISDTFDVLDGQHRLWAVAEAKRAVETLVVFGISREAFDTIDTIRRYRNAADTVALEGIVRHRTTIAGALSWLIRYERGTLQTYKTPANRVENSDVKQALRDNPNVVAAAERTGPLRKIINAGLMTFFYYVLSSQNTALAEEMVEVLVDPGRTPLGHPYYLLRTYLVSEMTRKEAVRTIALMIKTSNAAFRGAKLASLPVYNPQGRNPERFPVLEVRNVRKEGVVR